MRYFLLNAHSRILCGKEYMILDDFTMEADHYIREKQISSYCPWLQKSCDFNLSQLDSPSKFSEIGRIYSYSSKNINQYEYAVKVLKKRKNIKPIVLSIYDPCKDSRDHVPTPCINNITLDLYDGFVNMQVNYSTMNIFRMGLFDFHQMALLHERFAIDSDYKVGRLRINSTQLHMPVFDYAVSKEIFG